MLLCSHFCCHICANVSNEKQISGISEQCSFEYVTSLQADFILLPRKKDPSFVLYLFITYSGLFLFCRFLSVNTCPGILRILFYETCIYFSLSLVQCYNIFVSKFFFFHLRFSRVFRS